MSIFESLKTFLKLKVIFKSKIFLMCCLLFCLAACGKDYVTGKKVYNLYPLSTDIKLGTDVMQQQLKSLKRAKKKIDLDADSDSFMLLREVAKRIQAVSHISEFPFEVHLADLEVVNAWCAPGGKIMFYTGLWDEKKGLVKKADVDEIAAVMAHEVAHATARHVTETMSKAQSMAVIGGIATSAIGVGSETGADLFRRVFSNGMNIYLPSYSRENESEADAIGLRYMAMAGYDPRAAIRLWERAAKKNGDKTSIFASHPASGTRAENLRKLLPEAIEIYNAVGKAPK